MADVYVDRGRELGIFPTDASVPPAITDDELKLLGNPLLEKIEAGEADGTLAEAPIYYDIVRAWGHLGGSEPCKAWLTRGMMESAEFMAKAARGLVSYSIGTEERRYTMKSLTSPELYDPQVLLTAGRKHLADDEMTPDQRNLLKAIVKGAEQLQQGQSSESAQDQTND